MDAQTKARTDVRRTGLQKNSKPHRIATTPIRQGGVDTLLSRLERVKRTGNGTWLARCPAHADKNPSLSIRETDDGKVLVKCHAGCSVHEVVAAVGLELTALFPPRPSDPTHVGRPERRPFPAADVLRAVAFEASIVAFSAMAMHKGEALSDEDRARLLVANRRIQNALDAAGVRHE